MAETDWLFILERNGSSRSHKAEFKIERPIRSRKQGRWIGDRRVNGKKLTVKVNEVAQSDIPTSHV